MRKNFSRPPTEFEARMHGAPALSVLLLDLGRALVHRIAFPVQLEESVPKIGDGPR